MKSFFDFLPRIIAVKAKIIASRQIKIPNTGTQKNQQIHRDNVPTISAARALYLGCCIKIFYA